MSLIRSMITPTALLRASKLDIFRMTWRQRLRSKEVVRQEVPKYNAVIKQLRKIGGEENRRLVQALKEDRHKLKSLVA